MLIPTSGAYAASSHEPTFIGEVGLKVRSMCRKRPGRPRSSTSSTIDSVIPASAATLPARASPGRPVSWPPAANTDEAPARPPR